ncbi:MAG: hypothetical protein ACFBSG_02655 [Leptolyngbyaceae cyanobacterium]
MTTTIKPQSPFSALKQKLKQNLKRKRSRLVEMTAYWADTTKSLKDDQIRVVIFAQGRTGSTLLENLLSSTGHFQEHGELLNTEFQEEVLFPIPFVRGLAKCSPKHFIFHSKLYHLTEDRQRSVDPVYFLQSLCAQGWKIVYLKRENKISHALSNIIAKRRSIYHKYDNSKINLELTIDCQELVHWVERRFVLEAAENQVLEHFQGYETVIYEDDLMDGDAHQKTVDRLLGYLRLEHREAQSKTKKINTLSLRELISNYDEFLDCVHQHGWEKYLPEDE